MFKTNNAIQGFISMKIYENNSIIEEFTKQRKSYIVMVNDNTDFNEDIDVRIRNIVIKKLYRLGYDLPYFEAYYEFDTEEEAYDFYKVFESKCVDSSCIYACVFGPNGCETENT